MVFRSNKYNACVQCAIDNNHIGKLHTFDTISDPSKFNEQAINAIKIIRSNSVCRINRTMI